MLGRERGKPKLMGDVVWKFQISLRKHEYHLNMRWTWRHPAQRIAAWYWHAVYYAWSVVLGFTIPPNVFGPGLNIHHYGCVVVNAHARVGRNCTVQQGVNIGQSYSKADVPTIGDNVYLGPGAKLFGRISVGDGSAIGANAVVTRDVPAGVTVAGAPARVVNHRGSEGLLRPTV